MKKNHPTQWGAIIGAGLLATVCLIPEVRGEMVFETGPQSGVMPQAAPGGQMMPMQQVSPQQQQVMPQQVMQQQPMAPQAIYVAPQTQMPAMQAPVVNVGPAQTYGDEISSESKSELMRNARKRAERKNEDLLQERLEQLRLQDEQRRLDLMFGNQAAGMVPAVQEVPVQQAPVVTEHIGQVARQPLAAQNAAPMGPTAPMIQDALVSQAAANTFMDTSDRTIMMIAPRFGLSEMNSNNGYDFRPRFSGGLSLSVVTSDNLSFEIGYTYSEFGVSLAGYSAAQSETFAMKQNVIDAGMKLHFLGPEAKLRPFIGGGAAYALSYINYSQQVLSWFNSNPAFAASAQDYQLSSYLGFLSAGLDLKVNKSVYVGAMMKYYNVLSSRERGAVYGYNPYGAMPADAAKQYIGGSISGASFYSILGSVSFVF